MKIRGREFRLPRLRVRTMLILVAIVAFAIEGTRTAFRWHQYRSMHRLSLEAEESCRSAAAEAEKAAAEFDRLIRIIPDQTPELTGEAAKVKKSAEEMRAEADWWARSAKRFDEARRHPWRRVAIESPPTSSPVP